jgi:hypothetical protein
MATAKKTVAKKAVTKKTTAKPTGSQTGDPAEGLVANAAGEVIKGKMGTGRERDIALRAAGHDPVAVQKEVARQLYQQQNETTT